MKSEMGVVAFCLVVLVYYFYYLLVRYQLPAASHFLSSSNANSISNYRRS